MSHEVHTGNGHVPHNHYGKPTLVLLCHIVKQGLDGGLFRTYHVGEGNDITFAIQTDDVVILPAVGSRGAVAGGRPTDEGYVAQFPHHVVRLYAGSRVVVACSDDDCHCRVAVVEADEVVVEGVAGGGGRLGDVEDVATHQQGIRLVLGAPLVQLLEEMLVLIVAVVVLVHHLSEVKVGSMEELHGGVCFYERRN